MSAVVKRTINNTVQIISGSGVVSLDFGGSTAVRTIQLRANLDVGGSPSAITVVINGTLTLTTAAFRLSVDFDITTITVQTSSLATVDVVYTLVE